MSEKNTKIKIKVSFTTDGYWATPNQDALRGYWPFSTFSVKQKCKAYRVYTIIRLNICNRDQELAFYTIN